jgi:hypothetical protein
MKKVLLSQVIVLVAILSIVGCARNISSGGSSSEESRSREYSWGKVVDVSDPRGIAYGDGMYMIVGCYGEIYISEDGRVWNLIDHPGRMYYYDVIYVESVGFVVTGARGGVFLYNRDGTWSDMSIPVTCVIEGITHAEGMYVAVGADGKIYTRRDGDTSWTVALSSYCDLEDVAYADGKFTAVGYYGTILTSGDGANWTQVPALDRSSYYNAVAGGGGIIVAVGWSGQITTCDSGGGWTTQTLNETGGFNDVICVEGVGFVAVGYDTDKGVIYTSRDGLNWIPQSVPAGVHYFYGVTYDYDNGKFVAVDGNGTAIEITLSTSGTWRCGPGSNAAGRVALSNCRRLSQRRENAGERVRRSAEGGAAEAIRRRAGDHRRRPAAGKKNRHSSPIGKTAAYG